MRKEIFIQMPSKIKVLKVKFNPKKYAVADLQDAPSIINNVTLKC